MILQNIIPHRYLIVGTFALKLHGFDVQPKDIDIWLGFDANQMNWTESTERIKSLNDSFEGFKFDFTYTEEKRSMDQFNFVYNHHSFQTNYGRIPKFPIAYSGKMIMNREKELEFQNDFQKMLNQLL